jgi:anti-anti-sigma regulatory factor
MENKIKAKRVGDVNIFEIFGQLTGDFAVRGNDAIQQSLCASKKRNILFNIQELQQIDEVGIDAILRNSEMAVKSALLTGRCPIVGMIQNKDTMRRLFMLKNELEAAQFFSREFAAPTLEEQIYPERRRFIRLKTVLPLHFWCDWDDDRKLEFFAVVTNLSEGGLFAQFIESVSENDAKKNLNPYDLRLLHLNVGLIGHEPLSLNGKIVHGNLLEGGIGIEFYDVDEDNRLRLRDWLAQHLTEREG